MPVNHSSASLLVASPLLRDTNFEQSVVLLVEHNQTGAFGFIVNRPSPVHLGEVVIFKSEQPLPSHLNVWYGGPVSLDSAIILEERPDDGQGPAFALKADEASLLKLVQESQRQALDADAFHETKGQARSRFIVGYAGWGVSQLDQELIQGAWIQIPYSNQLIFDTPHELMWSRAFASIGVAPERIAPSAHTYLN